jgi:hypothetical protein
MQTGTMKVSTKAGEMYFVGTVVDISLPLANISGIITDHR